MFGIIQDDSDATVHRRRNVDTARHHDGDVLLDRRDHSIRTQPHLGVGAVENDDTRLGGAAQKIQRVEREPEVLQRRDVEGGEQDDLVA